jgi:peptide deformylase
MQLPLAYYGDPILRQKAKHVTEFNEELRQFVDAMIETMIENDGMGLAAPQVHKSLAVFITKVPQPGPDNKYVEGPLRIFINPKIEWYSEEVWEASEGCLSIPGVRGDVIRPFKIRVTAYDLDGQQFTEEFQSWDAKAIMHENDHINGVLYIDRMQGKKKKELEHHLQAVKKKYKKK